MAIIWSNWILFCKEVEIVVAGSRVGTFIGREREGNMKPGKATMRSVLLIIPALALATPALAQTRSTLLSDSEEPGSVIVFPKFINAPAVSLPAPETATVPVTELEIGVVCPKGVVCPEHEPVKIRFHWVCGTTEANNAGSFVCPELDFDVTATVWEKIVLVPDGSTAGTYNFPGGILGNSLPTKTVPQAPCPAGYLIGWVINPANDQPVKFDGLIGDAHLRPGSASAAPIGSPTALADYDAIPIQADPRLANGAAITTKANGALLFDGGAGHYLAVTGQVLGDVRYTNLPPGPVGSTFTLGALTLLTLDVKSNRPNNPVFVDLDFFGAFGSLIGNENQISTFTEFICWGEIPLNTIANGELTTAVLGRKGVFVSDQAVKEQIFGISDDSGPTTLLGLSEVLEGGTVNPWPRASFTNLFNSSNPVATHFLPTPSPNFLP
jgi:hypothetical protein